MARGIYGKEILESEEAEWRLKKHAKNVAARVWEWGKKGLF